MREQAQPPVMDYREQSQTGFQFPKRVEEQPMEQPTLEPMTMHQSQNEPVSISRVY